MLSVRTVYVLGSLQLAVQLWHASIAIALAILWMAHLLNPYLILASAFLFSLGFAFSSPAQSAVFAEMVSSEELASAYTLGGLQMNISGIIGPLLGGLLIPLVGVSFIFGGNGVGFLIMFLVILGWQRLRTQSKLPLENFFESFTTAIRYVRYSPGIKILLARHALFSFFIAIIPSLMPSWASRNCTWKLPTWDISLPARLSAQSSAALSSFRGHAPGFRRNASRPWPIYCCCSTSV